MTTISQTIVTTGTHAATVDNNQTLILTANALLMSQTVATVSAGSNTTLNILGDIYSGSAEGVDAGPTLHMTIAATGSISSNLTAIYAAGGVIAINNAGDVLSRNDPGHYAVDLNGTSMSVINSGSIRSFAGGAVRFQTANAVLINSGAIEAFSTEVNDNGVNFFSSGAVTNTVKGIIVGHYAVNFFGAGVVDNAGLIGNAQTDIGVFGSDKADRVTNTGTIEGTSEAVWLYDGNDLYNGAGGRLVGQASGGDGNDTLIGGAFTDLLSGDDGNDTIVGNGGFDKLSGGDGDDSYQLGADTTDIVNENAGGGTDLIWSTISRSLAGYAQIEKLTLQGTANINGTGNDLHNTIVGNSGKNVLTGGIGNDTLDGGAGADTLNGGPGDDYFLLGNSTDTVIDTSGTGDSIFTSITRSLVSYPTIEGIVLQGTANINGTGNGLSNTLSGNPGKNVFKGGAGSDLIYGGAGTDSLYGEAGTDTFVYLNYFDSPANATRDVIYDFNDSGANTDKINLAQLPGVDNPAQIVLTAAGANTLATVVVTGVAVTSILLAGTTIGNGIGQVDIGDFMI